MQVELANYRQTELAMIPLGIGAFRGARRQTPVRSHRSWGYGCGPHRPGGFRNTASIFWDEIAYRDETYQIGQRRTDLFEYMTSGVRLWQAKF